ncbi:MULTISPECIES: hypothetical protein [Corynebacterium]|uniref:hypothetical protein n=1 Tax=Corynebacterium TaxID=1716 RepID=UPI00254DD2FB|nr:MULTISPECIES: hypothetical protein [Corynebacterium]MDK6259287.1 hypothetical protein [Corynebacterium frankenforstense]MDK8894509.1 hypothetical protein [Corynebacterium sp. MSK006]
MQRFAAELRHRELTQELYDIGDEVASYIENLAEAVADFDVELVHDCLAEFDIIAGEGRADSRVVLGELVGLRQALTSGVRSGTLSVFNRPAAAPAADGPGQLTAADLLAGHPLTGPVVVAELAAALDGRTTATTDHLAALVEHLLERTDTVARDLDSFSYPHFLARLAADVHAAVEGWCATVAEAYPAYARARRGSHPAAFLAERARIDAVVARVAARRRAASGTGGAAG